MPRKKKVTRAERNIAWLEHFIRIPEGKFVGQPLKMAPFMVEDFKAIYDNPHGTRRAIISRGRKNAKTTESAMITILHLCGPEAIPNSQLFSAAQSRDQAAVLFQLAAKMVRMSPELNGVLTIRETAKQIACPEVGSLYRALSAEASTAFGLSPCLVIHDELGQVRGPKSDLYEALETAGAAQDNPLSVIISTQAPKPTDLLSILIEDAATGRDPHTVLRFDTADEKLETFSEEAIRSANPAFDIFMNKDVVLSMMNDAKAMPARQAEFENLVLNRQVEVFSPFVSRAIWEAGLGKIEPIGDRPVYMGLDLSSVNDLTAKIILTPVGEDGWEVHPSFWLPGQGLTEKSNQDRVPYDLWAKQGFLNTTDGPTVNYEFVAQSLFDDCEKYDVRAIAFDRWNFKHLKSWLLQVGFEEEQLNGDNSLFVPFGQGYQSMSPALLELEGDLLESKIIHDGNPVMNMCVTNAIVTRDPAGNRKLDKSKTTGRIDGMVALAMARAMASTYEGSLSSYTADYGIVVV